MKCTREDIIRMAREAGVSFGLPPDTYKEHAEAVFNRLHRFAALVAAATKEEMLMAGNDEWLEEARRQEREACAKIAANGGDSRPVTDPDRYLPGAKAASQATAKGIAAAIRARSKT